MNKTAIAISFIAFLTIALGGIIYLAVEKPESVGALVTAVMILGGAITTFILNFSGLKAQERKIDKVVKQTNGTLSRLQEENERLARENAALNRQLPPRE